MLWVLLAALAWPQTAGLVGRQPAAIPDPPPRGAEFVSYGKAEFGRGGRAWLRFFRLQDQDYLDVYSGVPRRRLKLDFTMTPGREGWQTTWLRPSVKAGPVVVVTDEDAFLVIAFPEGLRGPVYQQMFSRGSSSLSATEVRLAEPDERGYVQVSEDIYDADGTLTRTYRWTGKGWAEKK